MAHEKDISEKESSGHGFHILPVKTALLVGLGLYIMTWVTVAVSRVELGVLNFPVAMLIATIKAAMVVFIFMGLKYDSNENRVIFLTSFVFGAIFVVLTSTDLLFRGHIYTSGPLQSVWAQTVPQAADAGGSQFDKPWEPNPQLIARGGELYAAQCASCHGVKGGGDGPAAPALNPPPRNFLQAQGWTKGRKPSQVYDAVTNGVPGTPMPPFGTLSLDDRWGLTHYVLSLGPAAEKDTVADLKAVGIDPTAPGGGAGTAKKAISIDTAIEILSED